MKKIIILAALFVMVATLVAVDFSYALTTPGTGEIRGQGKFMSDPHRTFRLVRYMQNTNDGLACQLTKDAIVIWDTSASGDDAVTVTTSSTSNDSRVAGISIAAIGTHDPKVADYLEAKYDLAEANWGYIQTYGLSQVDLVPNIAVAVGNSLAIGNLAGYASYYKASEDGQTNLDDKTSCGQYGVAGFFYDAGTMGQTDVEVFVKCE